MTNQQAERVRVAMEGYELIALLYERALAAKNALGPEHTDNPACECEVCDTEREIHYVEKNTLDAIRSAQR